VTSKQRMLTAMTGGVPDMVPVAPDVSNMIPCKLTGKPFWDIYLYEDPPLWRAYLEAVRRFGFDGWLPSVPIHLRFDEEAESAPGGEAIVRREPDRLTTRRYTLEGGRMVWSDRATVYFSDNPPYRNATLRQARLREGDPREWEEVRRRSDYPGYEAFREASRIMGDSGVVGLQVSMPGLNVKEPDSIYRYYDDHDAVVKECALAHERMIARTREVLAIGPDFLMIGNSGHMIANPEPIFRELSLPTLVEVTRLAREAGIPSQVHCCGPEHSLVKMAVEESDLDSINPLELPISGGDCTLAGLRAEFGHAISLMGNLHTGGLMLLGSPEEVARESRRAIDDAAAGGGFILSTGDQCGRDTPFANLDAMIETARTYGLYR
jgi:uroporphyrinogen decarboxylase